jgi:hypothetical protein
VAFVIVLFGTGTRGEDFSNNEQYFLWIEGLQAGLIVLQLVLLQLVMFSGVREGYAKIERSLHSRKSQMTLSGDSASSGEVKKSEKNIEMSVSMQGKSIEEMWEVAFRDF